MLSAIKFVCNVVGYKICRRCCLLYNVSAMLSDKMCLLFNVFRDLPHCTFLASAYMSDMSAMDNLFQEW